MESLAYLHLELAKQQAEVQQNDSNNIGASWDQSAWNEIFDSIDVKKKRKRKRNDPKK